MNQNLTEMVFIIDRSGSMNHLQSETISGFNSMIEKQKKEPGEAFVTTILFDNQYELLHNHVNIQDAKPITDREYYARGMTALLDAVGRTINSVGERLSKTPEEERPGHVIFVITTDGHENASHEFTKAKVKEMIEHQQDKYSWTFMFLGANIDAVSEAASLGINTDFARKYTASSIGTDTLYSGMANTVSCMRSADFNVKSINSTVYKAATTALDDVQ